MLYAYHLFPAPEPPVSSAKKQPSVEKKPSVEKITIALTPEMAAFVRAEVAAGRYASTSEAVREAVRLWRERRENWGYTIEELRAAIDEGIASGPAQPAGPIMERLLAKYAAPDSQVEAAE